MIIVLLSSCLFLKRKKKQQKKTVTFFIYMWPYWFCNMFVFILLLRICVLGEISFYLVGTQILCQSKYPSISHCKHFVSFQSICHNAFKIWEECCGWRMILLYVTMNALTVLLHYLFACFWSLSNQCEMLFNCFTNGSGVLPQHLNCW